MKRLLAIMRKEFLHIFRDPRSLMILFIMPIMMLLLFGYAVRLDIKNIELAVWDMDQTPASRDVIRRFENSGYFRITRYERGTLDPHTMFLEGSAQAILGVPAGFAASALPSPEPLLFITDASDANTATIASQYAEQIVLDYYLDQMTATSPLLDIRSLILFNPELESTHFIVPGLVAVLFMMVCALLTSVTIAREKETGTMEQILVSPVRVREIIIGKVLPYVVLASLLAVLAITLAMLWFGVPFKGNPWLLTLYSLLYIVCSLALGILISTKAKTMQVAMMMALVITMLPSVMLSGFMFPIRSMPKIIQFLTHIVPAKYYLIIIRGIMLKGIGSTALQSQVVALIIFSIVLLAVSIKRFKASLE